MRRRFQFDALVTGAAGFIGGHLVRYIHHRYGNVVAVSRSSDQRFLQWPTREFKIIPWDMSGEVPSLPKCRVWFHLAANTDVRFCNMYPDQAEATNALSLPTILSAAESSDCETFILVSTLGVYGNPRYFPTDEAHPKQPLEAYAASKAKAEDILQNFRSNRMSRVIVRLFNTFGPGQKSTMLIPTLIRQALSSDVVEVHNLDCTRDFIYVGDVVKGLCECGKKAGDGNIINLGSGTEISIRQLIRTLEEALDRQLQIHTKIQSSPYEQVTRSQADIAKARSILRWRPQVSLLDGLRLTIAQAIPNNPLSVKPDKH